MPSYRPDDPQPDPKPRKRGPRKGGPTPIIPRKPKNPNIGKKRKPNSPTTPSAGNMGGRKRTPNSRVIPLPNPKGPRGSRPKPKPLPNPKGPNGSRKPMPMPNPKGPRGNAITLKPAKPAGGSANINTIRGISNKPAKLPKDSGNATKPKGDGWVNMAPPGFPPKWRKKGSIKPRKNYGMGMIPVGGRRRGI